MSFGGYIGTTGTRGPIDVLAMRKHHNKWLGELELSNRTQLDRIGETAKHHAAATAAVKRRSGVMAGGWKVLRERSENALTVSLVTNVKHALFHERGTGLFGPLHHWIYPKRAALLRWKNPDTGMWCSAKRVRGVKRKWIGKSAARTAGNLGKSKLGNAAAVLARRF